MNYWKNTLLGLLVVGLATPMAAGVGDTDENCEPAGGPVVCADAFASAWMVDASDCVTRSPFLHWKCYDGQLNGGGSGTVPGIAEIRGHIIGLPVTDTCPFTSQSGCDTGPHNAPANWRGPGDECSRASVEATSTLGVVAQAEALVSCPYA